MNTVYTLKKRLEKVQRLLLSAISNNYPDKVGQAKYLIYCINKEIDRLLNIQPPHFCVSNFRVAQLENPTHKKKL